jgi:branched-chain amino acid transport system substrate-binding protein
MAAGRVDSAARQPTFWSHTMLNRLIVSIFAASLLGAASHLGATSLLGIAPALAADGVKIGLITTLSGPNGVTGKDVKNGAELGVNLLGKKMGGLPVQMFYGDDQGKPDVGRQIAEEMITQDKVDFIIGPTLSNVLLAIHPLVVGAHVIMFGGQAGPSQLAGAGCSPYYFGVGIENQTMGEAMGKEMADLHLDGVYLMTLNYAGGKEVMVGFKRYYKGKITGEVYTPFNQLDFQTELTQIRASGPKAIFTFYPGGWGIQFLKQYAQSGLRGKIPLYTIVTNETELPAVGDTAEGVNDATNWAPHLDNAANKRFVADFRKAYGYVPSELAAVSYDTINLIDSAVIAVKGKVEDRSADIAALEKANFKSVRGKFSFNTNHFPIQSWYLARIVKGSDGAYYRNPVKTIFADHKDAAAAECKMP